MEKTLFQPTVQRERVYDVLRGVAILGILLANMEAFRGPMMGAQMGVIEKDATGIARLIDLATIIFVNGKFRAMLGILFGIGLWIQYARRGGDPTLWPGGYLKRTLFLAILGAIHGIFIWYGDILFTYACVAFFACFIANQSEKVLRTIVWIGVGLLFVCGFCIAGLSAIPSEPGQQDSTFDVFGGMLNFLKPAAELAAYQSGSYLDQLVHRSQFFFLMGLPGAVMYVPAMLPLFVFGILLARERVLLHPSEFPRVRNLCLWIGLGLGLPLNAIVLAMWQRGDVLAFRMLNEFGFGGFLAVGYLMLGAVAVEKGWLMPIQNLLAKVGQVALTNYLLQSVLCTAVFYSWGGGQFGRMSVENSLFVVLGVWLICVVFSVVWLRRFAIGPVEWAWRSATEGRKLPWTREGIAAMKAPQPEVAPKFDL